MNAKVRTCLWFDGDGLEAAEFYVSLLPNSRIERTATVEPEGPPLVIDFTLGGTPYQILNGGPQFKHTEAASISVVTEDQAETDALWDALAANGGAESQCGWLRDRFGVWWQLVPKALMPLLGDEDRGAVGRVMKALMGMRKIDISALEAAFNSE